MSPIVGGKHFPYTKGGIKDAAAAAAKKARPRIMTSDGFMPRKGVGLGLGKGFGQGIAAKARQMAGDISKGVMDKTVKALPIAGSTARTARPERPARPMRTL